MGREAKAEGGILTARPMNRIEAREAVHGIQALGFGEARDGLVYIPEKYRAGSLTPLLVLLHGAGGRAPDLVGHFTETAEARGYLVLAPESRGQTWDVILGGYGPDIAFIDRALSAVFERYSVDGSRIAVAGFSDGASYALSIGLANGGLFGDILAFSPGFAAPARYAGKPRIFMSHGLRDAVLPIDACSRRLAPVLRRAGYDLDYREFDDGHVVPADMVSAAVARFLN
jgi:phospholipase/carboxylesterase